MNVNMKIGRFLLQKKLANKKKILHKKSFILQPNFDYYLTVVLATFL